MERQHVRVERDFGFAIHSQANIALAMIQRRGCRLHRSHAKGGIGVGGQHHEEQHGEARRSQYHWLQNSSGEVDDDLDRVRRDELDEFEDQHALRAALAIRAISKTGCVRQFLEALRDGNAIHLHEPRAQDPYTFRFGRQGLHRRIREDWSFPDPPSITMQSGSPRCRGKRYSFSCPVCPNLDDRRASYRRHDDGIGSQRQRAGISSSGLRLLHRRGIDSARTVSRARRIQARAT